jgi:hypothetical protein
MSDYWFGLVIGCTEPSQSAVSSPVAVLQQLPTADIPLTLGSQTIPMPQLPASNSNSPLTNQLLTNSLHSTVLNCTALTNCQSQSYFVAGSLLPISLSCFQVPWVPRPVFYFEFNTCCHSPYVTSSLMRGWVCCLQLLLAPASAVILRSESLRTHYHILLSQTQLP